MNFASWIILLIVIAVVILDVRYLASHGLADCSGSCSSCGTSCKWVGDVRKAQRAAARRRKLKAFFHIS